MTDSVENLVKEGYLKKLSRKGAWPSQSMFGYLNLKYIGLDG